MSVAERMRRVGFAALIVLAHIVILPLAITLVLIFGWARYRALPDLPSAARTDAQLAETHQRLER